MIKKKIACYKISIFILLIVLSFSDLQAQNKYDFDQYFKETGNYFKQPIKWNLKDWLILTGIAGSAYLIMHVDEDIRYSWKKNSSGLHDIPISFGTFYGEPLTPLLLGAFFFIYGNSNDNQANKKLGFEIWQSASYVIFTTAIIKVSLGRARPDMNLGPFNYKPFQSFDDNQLSMNSGHTALAFSTSAVIAQNSESTFSKILAYLPAVLTSVSRIYDDKHWASDVFVGALVGYFSAKFVTDLHEQNDLNYVQPIQSQIVTFTFQL